MKMPQVRFHTYRHSGDQSSQYLSDIEVPGMAVISGQQLQPGIGLRCFWRQELQNYGEGEQCTMTFWSGGSPALERLGNKRS
jgi:hypothetical protein